MNGRQEDILTQLSAARRGPFLHVENGRGLLRMRGRDARDLLHRLSSARIDNLATGEVRETLLTNEKGRVIDALLVTADDEGLLLLTSAGRTDEVRVWLEKYTIMEDCSYEDISGSALQISLYNIPAEQCDLPGDIPLPDAGSSRTAMFDGREALLLAHDSVTGAGVRLRVSPEDAESVLHFLTGTAGIPEIGDHAYDLWRIDGLVPAVGRELTDRSNPLEAGAEAAVDFRKGCFIGQEVIARLDSYDKVQRHPRRLRFHGFGPDDRPEDAALLAADGADAGHVTTAAWHPAEAALLGIGLVRNAFAQAGTRLRCGAAEAEVLE